MSPESLKKQKKVNEEEEEEVEEERKVSTMLYIEESFTTYSLVGGILCMDVTYVYM